MSLPLPPDVHLSVRIVLTRCYPRLVRVATPLSVRR